MSLLKNKRQHWLRKGFLIIFQAEEGKGIATDEDEKKEMKL